MNDRYLYLPSIAFFGLLSSGIVWAVAGAKSAIGERTTQAGGILLTGAAAAVLMAGTMQYLPVWKNSLTLWNHAMKQAPELTVVRIQKAYTLHDAGRETDAMMTLQGALRECPRDSVDRPRVVETLKQWIQESATKDYQRRQRVGASTKGQTTHR